MDITKKLPTVIAFCAGYGGIERGLDLSGFEHRVIAYVEIEAYAIANLVAKMETGQLPPAPIYTDLKTFPAELFRGKVDLITGGYPCNHSVQQESDLEKMTLDTCGHTYGDTSKQLDLFGASLKTSKDISALDSEKSLAIWKKMVTEQRGEYSARKKLALPIDASGSTSWATPRAADSAGGPRTLNEKGQRISVSDPTKTYGANLSDQVRHWPTPSARDHKGGSGTIVREGDKFYRVSNTTQTRFGARLDAVVEHLHKTNWPTPTVGEEKFRLKGNSQASQCLEAKARKGELDNRVGKLNPDWVEQLMGVPSGWTSLTGTNTDWTYGWHDGSWEEGIPRVVESIEDRVCRIRLLGNGVVPATAAKAWLTLTERL